MRYINMPCVTIRDLEQELIIQFGRDFINDTGDLSTFLFGKDFNDETLFIPFFIGELDEDEYEAEIQADEHRFCLWNCITTFLGDLFPNDVYILIMIE